MMNRVIRAVAAVALLATSVASAAPAWSSVIWNAVTIGGNPYTDGHFDSATDPNYNQPPAPEMTDIVGNAARPAAYWSFDGQHLLFRLRVDGAPGAQPQTVWSALLNTDASPAADWVIQLDLKVDDQVELARATAGSPTDAPKPWGQLTYVQSPHTPPAGGVATDWYRFVDTGDSTTFPDTPAQTDYFVDFAFDLATFAAVSGFQGNSLQLAFATSTTHINSEQDLPDFGWSDAIAVPEPGTLALLALGAVALAFRRRKG